MSGVFFSLLRIFSISYVSGPRDFISTAVVALRRVQRLWAVSVFFFLIVGQHPVGLFVTGIAPDVCAPALCVCSVSVIGDSHRLHLEGCVVPDAGVAYQPDTRMFKLASVQKHPN